MKVQHNKSFLIPKIVNREDVAGFLLSYTLGDGGDLGMNSRCWLCSICVTIKKHVLGLGFGNTWDVHVLGSICGGPNWFFFFFDVSFFYFIVFRFDLLAMFLR